MLKICRHWKRTSNPVLVECWIGRVLYSWDRSMIFAERHMRGAELDGLSVEDLQTLEKNLESGLSRVLDRKGAILMGQINDLRRKGAQLMEENMKLRDQSIQISDVGKQMANDNDAVPAEDGHSSESVMTASHSAGASPDYDDSSDTSLKLGLPWND